MDYDLEFQVCVFACRKDILGFTERKLVHMQKADVRADPR